MRNWVTGLLLVPVLAAAAAAQDYTKSPSTEDYVDVPLGSTSLSITGAGADTETVELPFGFTYYGREYDRIHVCRAGWIMFNPTTTPPNGVNASVARAYPQATEYDGIVGPRWGQYHFFGVPTFGERIVAFTDGVAPDRRFIVAWDRIPSSTSTSNEGQCGFSFQVQLHEATGEVHFIRELLLNTCTKGSFYGSGIDSFGDDRFVVTVNNNTSNNDGLPPETKFTPTKATFTGTVRFDRIVSDADGVGDTVLEGQPLGAHRVQLRRDGFVVASAPTATDGSYSLDVFAVPAATTGELWVVAENDACTVVANQSAPTYEWRAQSSVSLNTTADLGALTLDGTTAADLELRAAMNLARVIKETRDWATPLTTAPIDPVLAVFDDQGGLQTAYAGSAALVIKQVIVAGVTTGNPDPWDDGIVTRTYARHLLAAIAANPSTAEDHTLDSATDTENAFAEAFGVYVWAARTGADTLVDGVNATTANVLDLEDPERTLVPSGGDIAINVIPALFDLTDGANEALDVIDGTTAPERAFEVIDTLVVPVTVEGFLQAWSDAGDDATALTRDLIGNRAVVDDDSELNDDAGEAMSLGAVSVKIQDRILQRFTEDWYEVTLGNPVDTFQVELSYNRVGLDSELALDVLSSVGTLIAQAAPRGNAGPFRADTGPLETGTYRLRIRHVSGVRVPDYDLQAFVPLDVPETPLAHWTAGREYDDAFGITGGVPPYVIDMPTLPTGFLLDLLNARLAGTPTVPGTFPLTINVTDDGDPTHSVQRIQTLVVAEALAIGIEDVFGFALDKAIDGPLPFVGGTSPIVFDSPAGGLPPGLARRPGTLEVFGTPTTPGSTPLSLHGIDVAGSESDIATLGVVCVPVPKKSNAAPLAAGDGAAGWFVDALRGSTLTFKVKTSKKRAKRLLVPTVIGPDGRAVVDGKQRGGKGKASYAKVPCTTTGRYYVIASSDAGDETELLGTPKLALPKKEKLRVEEFGIGSIVDVEFGALAGSTLKLSAKVDKRSGAAVQIQALIDPDGLAVAVGEFVVTKGTKQSLTFETAKAGTWRVRLLGSAANGGRLDVAYALKHPKDGAFVVD